jgi:RNA polymerase sigma-B factor
LSPDEPRRAADALAGAARALFDRNPDEHHGRSPGRAPSKAALRDQAIEAWLPLAAHLARRYAGRAEPFDDLNQVACSA